MKRFAFILLCLIGAAGGLALGRYVCAAPVSDAPVTRPSSPAPPQMAAPSVQESFAALRSGPRRAALIISLAARGEKRHLPALIEACAHDEAALQFLAGTWLQTDPGAFVQALAASKAMQGSRRMECAIALLNVVDRWGKKAPDEAWRGTASLHGALRRTALGKLAGQRVQADPRTGLEFLKSHPGIVTGGVDFEKTKMSAELLPLVLGLPQSPGKIQALSVATRELPLTEGMQALASAPDGVTAYAQSGLLRKAAAKSVENVIAFHTTASGPERYAAARAVGDQLLKDDPAAAATWAQDQLSGYNRVAIIRKAAETLQKNHPAAAEALRALLPESYRR